MRVSRLNGAERHLQPSFSKFIFFSSSLMLAAVLAAYLPMRKLPDRKSMPPARAALSYRPVALPSATGPLKLAGAWRMEAADPRFGGLSALAIDEGRFLAVSDLGAVVRFDPPTTDEPMAMLSDLDDGPGDPGRKASRDAESLARGPHGRGWWIGYEQHHSLWFYDDQVAWAKASIDLPELGWHDNRGAEGLLVRDGRLLVLAENGRDAVRIGPGRLQVLKLHADGDVAEATVAPDGGGWVLLRKKGLGGIEQSVAPLLKAHDGYRTGPSWPLPKAAFDNYEGMAIEALPGGGWRFWLVSDDGHRFMARTLLVALDLAVLKGKKP